MALSSFRNFVLWSISILTSRRIEEQLLGQFMLQTLVCVCVCVCLFFTSEHFTAWFHLHPSGLGSILINLANSCGCSWARRQSLVFIKAAYRRRLWVNTKEKDRLTSFIFQTADKSNNSYWRQSVIRPLIDDKIALESGESIVDIRVEGGGNTSRLTD